MVLVKSYQSLHHKNRSAAITKLQTTFLTLTICFEAMKANVPGPAFIQERTFSIKNSLDKENCGKVAQTRFEM